MAGTRGVSKLREPGFLLWLERFVGEWKLKDEIQVSRRDDGLLEAVSVDKGFKRVPLSPAIDKGEFIKPPKSPLGPYPVMLSIPLMWHWLPQKDFKKLKDAWHVGAGIKLILKAMERRIKAMSKAKRDKRWLEWWAQEAKTAPRMSPKDKATHLTLYRRYKSST